jgi:hypothetical protein
MANDHDRHHITPKARLGGRRDNIVVLPVGFHRALHQVFQDLTPDEYIVFLQAVLTPDTVWTSKDLHNLREQIKRGEA